VGTGTQTHTIVKRNVNSRHQEHPANKYSPRSLIHAESFRVRQFQSKKEKSHLLHSLISAYKGRDCPWTHSWFLEFAISPVCVHSNLQKGALQRDIPNPHSTSSSRYELNLHLPLDTAPAAVPLVPNPPKGAHYLNPIAQGHQPNLL
jgi:hypothetical protein